MLQNVEYRQAWYRVCYPCQGREQRWGSIPLFVDIVEHQNKRLSMALQQALKMRSKSAKAVASATVCLVIYFPKSIMDSGDCLLQ